MKPLPALLSIPHGGDRAPEELKGRLGIQPTDLLDDSDAYTRDIYDLGSKVVRVITADIARAFVDLNRTTSDRPPQKPDGIIKSITCYGRPIYIGGLEPDDEVIERLIERYYEPYHALIRNAVEDNQIEMAFDCHSMAAEGPAISPDVGKRRPMICLGNAHGRACSQETAERLAHCMREAFSLKEEEVTINRPFAGGHITRAYGGNPLPWIQVEMNRALYLSSPWFDRSSLTIDPDRLQTLNRMFEAALRLFFGKG